MDHCPSSDAHRGWVRIRSLQAENLTKLLNVKSGKEWWGLIRDWTDPKRRPMGVSVMQLYVDFHERSNPTVGPMGPVFHTLVQPFM
jgi:hypothetical protein